MTADNDPLFIFSEIAKPAASSPALLMRKPEDNLDKELLLEAFAAVRRE